MCVPAVENSGSFCRQTAQNQLPAQAHHRLCQRPIIDQSTLFRRRSCLEAEESREHEQQAPGSRGRQQAAEAGDRQQLAQAGSMQQEAEAGNRQQVAGSRSRAGTRQQAIAAIIAIAGLHVCSR